MTILFRSTWALSVMIAGYALAKVLTHNFRLFGDSVFTFISDPLNSQTFSGKTVVACSYLGGWHSHLSCRNIAQT